MHYQSKVAVLGAGLTRFMRRALETPKELAFEAARAALDDAGLSIKDIDRDGKLPVVPSGGSLGCGYTYDMSGLRSILEVVQQLRGTAGAHQVKDAKVGLAQSWRGIPTASGGVVALAS